MITKILKPKPTDFCRYSRRATSFIDFYLTLFNLLVIFKSGGREIHTLLECSQKIYEPFFTIPTDHFKIFGRIKLLS